jgi:4-hydroxybenzoate polyprenyltransferase
MASEPQQLPDVTEKQVESNSVTSGGRLRYRRVWDILEYTSAYLAVIAMAKVSIVMYILSLQLSLAPVVAGLITVAIYAIDRLVDAERDYQSTPNRVRFVRRHEDTLYVLAALAYGIGVALSVLGGPVAFGLALFPGSVWIIYACDWIPASELDIRRLKDILFVNSALVAIAWAIPTVVVPIVFADATFGPAALVLVVYFFLGTFANVEIANVRDIESDSQDGASTLPVVFGVARTRQILYALVGLTIVVLGYAASGGYLSGITAAILATGPISLVGSIALLGRVENSKLLTLVAECTRLPVFLLLAASGVIW